MRRFLFYFSILLAVVICIVWAASGQHRGWSQTKIEELHIDPVTGIEYAEYTDGFLPGIDFLASGLAVSVTMGLVSRFFPARKPS